MKKGFLGLLKEIKLYNGVLSYILKTILCVLFPALLAANACYF